MRKLLTIQTPKLPSRLLPVEYITQCRITTRPPSSSRCFAQVKDVEINDGHVSFRSSTAWHSLNSLDEKKPSERDLNLGKTVRELHERLPTLLQSPLPSEILSPQVSLHLFPSTHPHLPTVSGRIAYAAALWTAPVAWGKVPLVGNVKLTILSERMVRNGGCAIDTQCRDEKLIVKWKTIGKGGHRDTSGGVYRDTAISDQDPVDKIKAFLGRQTSNADAVQEEEFCGIFIFEFDEQGRLLKHIIEHTDQGTHWDKMSKVVSVTDWLLGKFSGNSTNVPALAYCHIQSGQRSRDRFPP